MPNSRPWFQKGQNLTQSQTRQDKNPSLWFPATNIGGVAPPWGRGVLPYKRLMGIWRWMGSHFHDWIDYKGVTFLIELLKWGRTF